MWIILKEVLAGSWKDLKYHTKITLISTKEAMITFAAAGAIFILYKIFKSIDENDKKEQLTQNNN